MTPPAAIWEVQYQADRRNHHHRCKCCMRVLADGDQALMIRVAAKKTHVIHLACGSVQHGDAAWTWRDAMEYWGIEYLNRCGWEISLPAQPKAVALAA
ncbi:hypothetical protein LP417_35880 (plasmid) [Polaromonas sp. P1-6]|nr:hypothetical protein LP417_35880 [Polaromonas sp. P1-6]